MEIQKIFSNTENEGEKLYSVLMSKDEINLYSQFQKEHSKVNWDEYNLSVFEKKEIKKEEKEFINIFRDKLPIDSYRIPKAVKIKTKDLRILGQKVDVTGTDELSIEDNVKRLKLINLQTVNYQKLTGVERNKLKNPSISIDLDAISVDFDNNIELLWRFDEKTGRLKDRVPDIYLDEND